MQFGKTAFAEKEVGRLQLVVDKPELCRYRVSIKTGEKRQIATLKDAYLYNIRLSPDKKTSRLPRTVKGRTIFG